jgi:hypothetical protein
MREYDDDIRLYTPVLQRIIILVAVIVAVPVVLWTITAFVRSYVAPPKLPTFQPMVLTPSLDSTAADAQASTASSPPSNLAPSLTSSTPALAQSAVPRAPFAATGTTTDGRSALLDIRKPPGGTPPQFAGPGGPGPAPQIAAAPAQPTITQPAAIAAPFPAQPMASAAAAQASPATPFGAAQNAAVRNDSGAAPPAADRSVAWPNPAGAAANAGTTTGTATSPMVAAASQPNSSNAGSDDLPVVKPIAGRVPLPRRRPNVIAMVQPSTSQPNATQTGAGQTMGQTTMGQTIAQNSVPLPRARPADAPVPAAPVITNDASYLDRGSEH